MDFLKEIKSRIHDIESLVFEAEKKEPEGEKDGTRWVTINGARVQINKDGKAIKGPEGATDAVNKTDAEKTQDNVNKILGDDSGMEAKENEDGETVLSHPEVEDEDGNPVEAKVEGGPKMANVLAGLMSWVDVAKAITIAGAGAVGRNMEKIIGQIGDALDAWQGGAHGS